MNGSTSQEHVDDVEDPADLSAFMMAASLQDDNASFSSSQSTQEQAPRLGIKEQAAKLERQTLGKRETRAILVLRILVVAIFIILAIAMSLTVYFFVRDSEEDNFKDEFGFYAQRVQLSFAGAISRLLGAADELSLSITSHALDTGSVFPNVTMPHFEYKGSAFRINSDSILAIYMPFVTAANRLAWEAYSAENNHHVVTAYINEEQEKLEQDKKFGITAKNKTGAGAEALEAGELSDPNFDIPTTIWFPSNFDGGEEEDDDLIEPPFFPMWQMTPLLPPEVDLINLDMSGFTWTQRSLNVLMETGQASFDVLTNLTQNDDSEDQTNAQNVFDLKLQSGQYRHNSENYENDPVSPLNYPVFDTFAEDRQPVGSIFTIVYWRFLFDNILPASVNGIDCVLKNSLGQTVTYRIDGPEAIFKGFGDLHDSKYDSMGKRVDIGQVIAALARPETRSFTAADLNNRALEYKVFVYPTDTFRSIYVKGDAGREAWVVAGIFLFAAAVFIAYDCCVQRRQRIVLDKAVRSTAVVSSLFPANVRDRILNDGTDGKNKSSQKNNKDAFLNIPGQQGIGGRPIADKFPNSTVFFADLAGFTKWSSSREPCDVFTLLESMFKEFDTIALRRGVFKVETIGDCYMAVTGLPDPQPDHAIRMAKFASDCLHKLDEVTARLADRLGAGTDALTLRIGMHSGEVTAGVLRGEKSRFQLFGDTVNTASRMESNGSPGKIQVSQSTADELILAGKSSWLTPRKEKVVAKGKGEMQTYWVEVPHDKSAHAKSAGSSSGGQPSVRDSQQTGTSVTASTMTNPLDSLSAGHNSSVVLSDGPEVRPPVEYDDCEACRR